MRRRRAPQLGAKLKDCAVCGWTYELTKLTPQGKGLVCPDCVDRPHSTRRRKTRVP